MTRTRSACSILDGAIVDVAVPRAGVKGWARQPVSTKWVQSTKDVNNITFVNVFCYGLVPDPYDLSLLHFFLY